MRISTNRGRTTGTLAHVQVATENLAASQARVGDPDVAAAMAAFARQRIGRRVGRLARTDAASRTSLRLLE